MTQCPLWKVVIIDIDIALQGLRPLLAGAKAVGRQDLADAAVKALDHAVGLGMARRDEAVLEVRCVADPIEAMLTRRFPLTGRAEPVGEFLAVIRQDLGDLKGSGLEEMWVRKPWARAADFSGKISTYTQRVARSMAANR